MQESPRDGVVSLVDGCMHACGHDAHTAAMLGVATALAGVREELPGRYVFVFQPAEEGLGGAKRMVDGGVLDGLDAASMVGCHVTSFAPVGLVALREGVLMSEAHSFSVTARGAGGHGAIAGTAGNVLLAVAALAGELGHVVEGMATDGTACACSAGMLRAGSAPNVVPSSASLRGTLRTFTDSQRETALTSLQAACDGIADAYACEVDLTVHDHAPAVVNADGPTAVVRREAAAVLGDDKVLTVPPVTPSDDVSSSSTACPAATSSSARDDLTAPRERTTAPRSPSTRAASRSPRACSPARRSRSPLPDLRGAPVEQDRAEQPLARAVHGRHRLEVTELVASHARRVPATQVQVVEGEGLVQEAQRAHDAGLPLWLAVALAGVLAEHVVERLAAAPPQLRALDVGLEGPVEREPRAEPRAEGDGELEALARRARERRDVGVVGDPGVELERRSEAALQLEAPPRVRSAAVRGVPGPPARSRFAPFWMTPSSTGPGNPSASRSACGRRTTRRATSSTSREGVMGQVVRSLTRSPSSSPRWSTSAALSDVAPTSTHTVTGVAPSRLTPRPP